MTHMTMKRLATRVPRYYYYTERGGELFLTHDGKPASKARVDEALSRHKPKPVDRTTVNSLIDLYMKSLEFGGLSVRSERNYTACLKKIGEKFGSYPFEHFTKPQARGVVKRWHHSFSDTPRMADEYLKVLVRLLNFAISEGLILAHCANKMPKLDSADRSHIIWADEELSALYSACSSQELEMTLRLAVCTGLRREALTRLPVSSIKGHYIEWVYGTGKKRIDVMIPVTHELGEVLRWFEERRGDITTVCFNSRGRPWTADGLSTSFMKARAGSGASKRFHDFRGTAATRYALQDFSDGQIADFLGWNPETVSKIIKRYVNRPQVAKANIIQMKGKM